MDKQKKLLYIKKVVPVLYTVTAGMICLYLSLHLRKFLNLIFPIESGYVLAPLLVCYLIAMHGISKHYFVAKNRFTTYLAGTSVFVILYSFMTCLVLDLLRWLLGFQISTQGGKDRLFLLCGVVCIVFVTGISLFAFYKASTLKVRTLSVPCDSLTGSCRLVLLSDLHIGYYVGVSMIRKMVEKINALDADLVVISGDTINAGNTSECPHLQQVAALLTQIRSREGVFAVTGNHDPDAKDPEFVKFLKDAHIRLLDDQVYTSQQFHLVGRSTRTHKRMDLKYLLRGLSKDKPVFVLDHDPLGISDAAEHYVDLVMCGHTHKGQVFPLNLFVRFLYKKDEIWGCSRRGKTNVIVSAGTGYFSMPMRLGSDCEIIAVDMNK